MDGAGGMIMLPYVGMDEYSSSCRGKYPGYISCKQLKESLASSIYGSSGGGNGRGGNSQQQASNQQQSFLFSGYSPNGLPMEPIVNISKRLWMSNQKVRNFPFYFDLTISKAELANACA
jgi:hypothetical protein